jgi:hypothetical protein
MNIFWRAVLLASVLPSTAACLLPAVALAARIDVGTHTLLPNTPGQVIEIYLEPSDPVDELLSLDFFAVLPPNNLPLSTGWFLDWAYRNERASNEAGPVFTALDISGVGTIFHTASAEIQVPEYWPRFMEASIITPPDQLVGGAGLLARLTIDTTGVIGRVGEDLLFPLRLTEEWAETRVMVCDPDDPFLFDDRNNSITDGFIRIAALPDSGAATAATAVLPEPDARSLASFGGTILAIGVYVLRRRRLALN